MAIIKHTTSKNANYSEVIDYLSMKHQEISFGKDTHYEPILDEHGLLQERDNYAMAYITSQGEEAEPEKWAAACMRTNLLYRKNLDEGDRKQHSYIISHPAEDRERMTMDDLMEEGRAFAQKYLHGYDVLIAVHRDTDNDHIHIVINSVRALQREQEEDWMMQDKTGKTLPCEMAAGGKHQDGPKLRRHMNEWLLDYSQQHGFTEKDNNAIADERKQRRHKSKNDEMKDALLEAAGRSRNFADLKKLMKEDYNMDLKVSGTQKTISVLYPGNEKYVRLRTLGLEPADLTRRFEKEVQEQDRERQYRYTKEEEERQVQREIEEQEKKKYIEWIRERRQKNYEKAEEAARHAEYLLARRLLERGESYYKEEFREINYLVKQNAYVVSNLEIEKEKLDKLLERWEKSQDESLSEQERRQHAGYVKWCGCDPDSALELEHLKCERDIIEAQQVHAKIIHEALLDQAERWRGRNNLTHSEDRMAWLKNYEKQLKLDLKAVKQRREELRQITKYCRRAAENEDRRIVQMCREDGGDPWEIINVKWDKVAKCERSYQYHVQKQQRIEKQLKEMKKRKREAKIKLREAKVKAKELHLSR